MDFWSVLATSMKSCFFFQELGEVLYSHKKAVLYNQHFLLRSYDSESLFLSSESSIF